MTIRLACVSTAKNTDAILKRLRGVAGDDLELALHFGSTSADYKATSLSKLNRREGRKGHLMAGTRYRGANLDLLAQADFKKNAEQFVDHMHRNSEAFAFRAHNIRSVQDFVDYYHILSDEISARLIEERITHVLFFNVPHLSYDTTIYHIAKAMGLEVVIVSQSLFPGKFYSMRDVADYGVLPDGGDAEPYAIERGETLDLFYMKGVGQERGEQGRISVKGIAQLFGYVLLRAPGKALNPVWMWRTVARMRKIYGGLPAWRDPFAKFFHENDLAYFEHILQFEEKPVDLSARYVYFAMQLQPEMTTSALGEQYRDQALAIEHLSAILPEGVKIYVKENPKQRSYMRGPMFFHRLRRIPQVEIVPSYTDTHALTDGSEFVATISGTVGWEAICKGKPACVFGNTWYGSFPGVTRFRDGVRYDDIAGNAPDHGALEAAAGRLMARLHDGVVDRHYTQLVECYDAARNADEVAAVLLGLLRGDRAFAFGP